MTTSNSDTMQTGSLINHIYPRGTPTPEVGMGATKLGWTDRDPYTVISVSASGKTIKVQSDNYVRTDRNGMSESQTYLFTPNPKGEVYTLRWTKRGWACKGQRFHVGTRAKYHDFSF